MAGAEEEIVDGANDGSVGADTSNDGSNWIIRPPCSMSFWCSGFWIGRCGAGDANIGWYEGCRCATREAIGDHHACVSWLLRSGVKEKEDVPRESEYHEDKDWEPEE